MELEGVEMEPQGEVEASVVRLVEISSFENV